jgi:hypothetical protein
MTLKQIRKLKFTHVIYVESFFESYAGTVPQYLLIVLEDATGVQIDGVWSIFHVFGCSVFGPQ